jgi:redox-sensitive bicupin YhaK (pirin superfamily)
MTFGTTQIAERDAAAAQNVRAVERIVRGSPANDGAGVRLSRIIGQKGLPDLDPFLLLDEFRSQEASDYLAGFPDHPHRGFETVTYMLAGRMRHGDNRGNVGLLRPGGVQWMTAGRGIVHSEMPEQENGLLWGYQLWVNLPAKDKMTAPRYQDIAPKAIPTVALAGGVRVKVIAGRVGGHSGPVAGVPTDPTYLDVSLPAGAAFRHVVPEDYTAFAYVIEGGARIGPEGDGKTVRRGELAVLGLGEAIRVDAEPSQPARLLLVAGRPLREPIAKYGPFVMNTAAELRRAFEDFRSGRL